jgi:hypothetical protein
LRKRRYTSVLKLTVVSGREVVRLDLSSIKDADFQKMAKKNLLKSTFVSDVNYHRSQSSECAAQRRDAEFVVKFVSASW